MDTSHQPFLSLRTIARTLIPCILFAAMFFVLFSCAGGGTSGSGIMKIAGLVYDQDTLPIPDVLVSDLINGNSAISDNEGKFKLESSVDSTLSFEVDGTQASLSLAGSVPENAAAVNMAFMFTRLTNQVELVAFEVIETRDGSAAVSSAATTSSTPTTPVPVADETLPPGGQPTKTPNAGPPPSNDTPDQAATPTQPQQDPPQLEPTATATPFPTTATDPPPAPEPPTPPPPPPPTEAPIVYPPRCPGDMNCNGVVDIYDTNAFTLALTDLEAYRDEYPGCDPMNADIDGNGVINSADTNPFLAIFAHGPHTCGDPPV